MFSFDRNNKTSGIYWLKQPIEDLSIKVALKPQTGILNLPKYEDFVNTSNEVDINKVDADRVSEYAFKWQEKVFSRWEINYYNDIHNGTGEDELENSEVLNSTEGKSQKVFTYINEDYHSTLPINSIENAQKKCNFDLHSCIEYLNLEDRISGIFGVSNSMHHLFSSDDNIIEKQKWMSMHVVFDDSVYSDDSQLVQKQEYVLLSLYYNSKENYLIISPDTNDLELNPYNVVLETGLSTFQCAFQISYGNVDNDKELVKLLNKLYTKWEKKHNQLTHFEPAPTGIKNVFVTFEIQTATDFDLDNIYIEYEIKIPENTKCESELHGRTHVSKGRMIDDTMSWTYGHVIELVLAVSEEAETSPLQMFFEAISIDWWGRHRTEGYCYLPLPLAPGHFSERLSCSRPEERNKVQADNRRFFVGGCHLIKDLEVLSKPQLQNAKFSYTATGSIQVRWNTISQSSAPGFEPASTPSSSSASALLQGAEAVLRQYSQARARLAAATKDLIDEN